MSETLKTAMTTAFTGVKNDVLTLCRHALKPNLIYLSI